MKTILYTTDCTKKSGSALIYAYRLSNALQARLHVLHVYDLQPIVTTSVRARGSLERNFAGEQAMLLEQYCSNQLKKEFGKPELHYHAIQHESVSQAVLDTAEKISADLVLAGHKNPRSIRGLFTEHIANSLMRKLSCPLLILPDDVVYEGLSTLLYATDFEESDLHALDFVARLAEPFGAQIDIIHIPRKNETYHQRKMEWFKDMLRMRIAYPEIYFASRKAEDVETGIHQFIDKSRPQLLGMMERQRRTYLETLFHKDLVQTIEDEVAIPLLVFNKRQLKLKFSREVQETDVLSYA